MGAKESEEMKKARDLVINQGMSGYRAANFTGISSSAIYMAKWYKDFKAASTVKK